MFITCFQKKGVVRTVCNKIQRHDYFSKCQDTMQRECTPSDREWLEAHLFSSANGIFLSAVSEHYSVFVPPERVRLCKSGMAKWASCYRCKQ